MSIHLYRYFFVWLFLGNIHVAYAETCLEPQVFTPLLQPAHQHELKDNMPYGIWRVEAPNGSIILKDKGHAIWNAVSIKGVLDDMMQVVTCKYTYISPGQNSLPFALVKDVKTIGGSGSKPVKVNLVVVPDSAFAWHKSRQEANVLVCRPSSTNHCEYSTRIIFENQSATLTKERGKK